jgi:hypothetical protein
MYVNLKRAVLCTALFLLGGCLLSACQSPPKEILEHLAINSFVNQPVTLNTDHFSILGWGNNRNSTNVNVYIEGDGQSWVDPWTISSDPTPPNPMGFKLSVADVRSDSILYLARPCQYIMDKRCTALDWTTQRFGHKVIWSYHQALDQIKNTWKAKTFTLHGYSGGATIVLLIAAHRQDVTSVFTFAPLLDPIQWTKHHHYSPLVGSLSPLEEAHHLKQIPQHHFIGLEDKEVPYHISSSYFAAIPESNIIVIHKLQDFNHHSDWPEFWKSYILKAK